MSVIYDKSLFKKKELIQLRDSNIISSENDDGSLNLYSEDKTTLRIPFNFMKRQKPKLTYSNKNPTFNTDIVLRDYQEDVMNETMSKIIKDNCVFLQLYCSFGKTKFSISLAQNLTMIDQINKIGILTHRTGLYNQWHQVISNETNARICCVGSEYIDKELPDADIYIFMCKTSTKYNYKTLSVIDMLIVDEAHTFCNDTGKTALLNFSPKILVGMSATPDHSDSFPHMLPLFFGENVIRKSDKEFIVFTIRTPYVPKITNQFEIDCKGGQLIWKQKMEYLGYHEDRNNFICNLAIVNENYKVLILVKYIFHAEILYDKLKNEFDEDVQKYAGNVKKIINSRIIIGTLSKMGEGFGAENIVKDYDGIPIDLVILAGDVIKCEQPFGRGWRSELPKIINIVDKDKALEKHNDTRIKWIKSAKGTMVAVDFKQVVNKSIYDVDEWYKSSDSKSSKQKRIGDKRRRSN